MVDPVTGLTEQRPAGFQLANPPLVDVDGDGHPDVEPGGTLGRFDPWSMSLIWPEPYWDFHMPGNAMRIVPINQQAGPPQGGPGNQPALPVIPALGPGQPGVGQPNWLQRNLGQVGQVLGLGGGNNQPQPAANGLGLIQPTSPTSAGGLSMINLGNHIIMDWNELRTFRGAQLVLLQQWNLNAAGGDPNRIKQCLDQQQPILYQAFGRMVYYHDQMANAFLAQNNINRANDYTLANLLPRFTDPTAANFISPETLLYQYQTYLNGGVTPDGVANPDQALYNQLSPYFNELNVYLSGSVIAQRLRDISTSNQPLTSTELNEYATFNTGQNFLHLNAVNQNGMVLPGNNTPMGRYYADLQRLLANPATIDPMAVQAKLDEINQYVQGRLQDMPNYAARWQAFSNKLDRLGLHVVQRTVTDTPGPDNHLTAPRQRTIYLIETTNGEPADIYQAEAIEGLSTDLLYLNLDQRNFQRTMAEYRYLVHGSRQVFGSLLQQTANGMGNGNPQAHELDALFGRFLKDGF